MKIKSFRIDPDEIIGNQTQFKQLEHCIKEKKPALLYGPPGIGKTTSVHLIAKRLGYHLIELNASDQRKKEDLQKILKDIQMKSLKPKIYFFDEVDGLYDEYYGRQDSFRILEKILIYSRYPIVLSCNEVWKIPEYIKNKCELIPYYPPSKEEIVKLIKNHLGNINNLRYDKISNDVRNSLISVFCGSEPYDSATNPYREVKNIFMRNEFRFYDNSLWIWLIDNVERFYEGRELFEVIKIITDAAFYDNPNLLKTVPKTKKINTRVEYPYYLERKKAVEKLH